MTRWLTRTPVPSLPAAALAAAGLVMSATTGVLAWQGLLAGPDVTGGGRPVVETVLLAAVGAAVGWFVARRGGRLSR